MATALLSPRTPDIYGISCRCPGAHRSLLKTLLVVSTNDIFQLTLGICTLTQTTA